jgi:hypothetical protein
VARKPAKKTNEAQWNQRRTLVDEFAWLEGQVQQFKPVMLRHEKLRRLILDWYPDVPPEEEIRVLGHAWEILITSRDRIRSVSLAGKKALFKLWGQGDFISKAVVLLKSLPDPEDDEGKYTVQALTGPRHLHVMSKDATAREKAAAAEPAA